MKDVVSWRPSLGYQGGHHCRGILLTLPYFACQAKKYNNAPKGCPTRQKLIQKIEFPIIRPESFILSSGWVTIISGNWSIIPANATPAREKSAKEIASYRTHDEANIVIVYSPIMLWVGIPTRSSCINAEKVNTTRLAAKGDQPRPTNGEKMCLFMKR